MFYFLILIISIFSQTIFASHIRSNNIDRIRYNENNLYIFTSAGFSVIDQVSSNANSISSFDYPFDYSNVRSIAVNNGKIYFSLREDIGNKIDDKIVVVNITGEIIEEIPTVWGNPPNDFFRQFLVQSDTIVAARWLAGLHFYDSQGWYYSAIDSSVSTSLELGQGDFFSSDNFNNHLESKPWNAVEGISYIDGNYIARTFNGLYTSQSLEGPWLQAYDTTLKAKRPLSVDKGDVAGKRVYYFWFTTGEQVAWDNKFKGEDTTPGFYYSIDTLKTFKFDARVSQTAVRSISAYDNRILFMSSDSLYIGEIEASGEIEWIPVSKNDFLTDQLKAATLISRETIFISTADKGVIYRYSDSQPWSYLLFPKDVNPGLKEVYSYPTILRPSGGNSLFAYSLSQDDIVSIKIFDWNGDFVRTVIEKEQRFQSFAQGASTDITRDFWDGRDNKGRMAPPGTYFFRIYAHNQKQEAFGKVILLRGDK